MDGSQLEREYLPLFLLISAYESIWRLLHLNVPLVYNSAFALLRFLCIQLAFDIYEHL